MRKHRTSLGSPELLARASRACLAAALAVVLSACGTKEPPESAESASPDSAVPAGGASGDATGNPGAGAAASPATSGTGALSATTTPGAPPIAGPSGAGAPAPAPGTQSLRFIVRVKETGAEIPAGSFAVRLLPLDPIREEPANGNASAGQAPPRGAGPRAGSATGSAGVSVDPAPNAGHARVERAAPAATEAPGKTPTYEGSPEQVLVTQPDGAKWTFLAGVKPGTYAMRITSAGRRMLLEVLTVRPDDKLIERALDRE